MFFKYTFQQANLNLLLIKIYTIYITISWLLYLSSIIFIISYKFSDYFSSKNISINLVLYISYKQLAKVYISLSFNVDKLLFNKNLKE